MARSRLARGDGLVVVAVGAFGALLATQVGRMMATDGWLALVAGRLIARDGLPSHNELTVLGGGERWVDQQWLGQLMLYGTERVAGITGVVVLNVLLVLGAYVLAVAAARMLGAQATSVAVVAVVGALPFVATASSVRTQSFAYLLFVGVVLLLRPRPLSAWRVVAVAGLLVLWANIHGSVLLAAAIVLLRGLVELRERGDRRLGLALVVLPLVCPFVSPYARGLPGYYADTAFNPAFGRYLAQWGPTGLQPVSVPVFVLVLGIAWLLGRAPGTFDRFERGLLIVAALVGLLAVRNWPWLVLVSLLLLPSGFDAARGATVRAAAARRVELVVGALGAALLVFPLAAALAGRSGAERALYPPAAADRVAAAAAARPGAVVRASVGFADWLLWQRPELAGRVLFDARYELLSDDEIERNALFRFGAGTGGALRRSRILVLDPDSDRRAVRAIRGRVRPLFRSEHAYVAITR